MPSIFTPLKVADKAAEVAVGLAWDSLKTSSKHIWERPVATLGKVGISGMVALYAYSAYRALDARERRELNTDLAQPQSESTISQAEPLVPLQLEEKSTLVIEEDVAV